MPKVAVGARNELEVARGLLIGSNGQEPLVLDRANKHRLFVQPKFPHFIEEEQTPIEHTLRRVVCIKG